MTVEQTELERMDALSIAPPELGARTDHARAGLSDVTAVADVTADEGGQLSEGILATAILALKIACVVAVVQLGLLFTFTSVSALEEIASGAMLDSLLLAMVSAPLIVLWIVRPYIAGRPEAYAKMAAMNRMLRQEIDARMAAEERLRAKEYDLELQIQDIAYVKDLVEAQASEAVGLAEDLAVQKKAVEESERRNDYLAKHDPLTGLPNRRHFEERLAEMKAAVTAENGSLALVYIDLDNFKTVNDTLGHQRGDDLLLDVAEKLSESVREQDFVARLGGDEFAIVSSAFAGSDDSRLAGFAERMRKALTIKVEALGRTISVSAAFGVACLPGDAEDEITLLQCADGAMYEAKARGRNCVVFFHELEKAIAAD